MFFRTRVSFERVFLIDGSLCFKTQNNVGFKINSLNAGVICVEPIGATNIEEFVAAILGCFDEKSNMYGLKEIEFNFEGVSITVNARNMDYDLIISEWYEKRTVKYEKRRLCD